jgi:hypothetical protein
LVSEWSQIITKGVRDELYKEAKVKQKCQVKIVAMIAAVPKLQFLE